MPAGGLPRCLMDPFATLGIARTFDVNLPALEKTHRELARALHPDRFAASGATERKMSGRIKVAQAATGEPKSCPITAATDR